ncbi:MAG TPA: hypothetical protein QF572_05395, partial [Vicinamibacterales bacterium]|nr:hypothetical protein [Vicinamibacterales bacterium]
LLITNQLLYQLSYAGLGWDVRASPSCGLVALPASPSLQRRRKGHANGLPLVRRRRGVVPPVAAAAQPDDRSTRARGRRPS